jgi:hypothetical protein
LIPFENHGFENASMRTLDCEIVHVVIFPHLQEYYEQELIPLHSSISQDDSPQANFQKVNKTKPELFDEQEDSLDTHNMAVIFEDVQGCMNVFVDMHGRVDKPIAAISFENILRTEEIEQEQQTLMKEACLSVFVHQEEMIPSCFHDPVACYMENFNNQNLRLRMDCKLRDEDNGKSTSILDMDCFTPVVSFQPVLSSDSKVVTTAVSADFSAS